MCASYTENYQSWEVITSGIVTAACDPWTFASYETGDWQTGCYYTKCPNGYASFLYNHWCRCGHSCTGTWAGGWAACPHGYPLTNTDTKRAHCTYDTDCETHGYRAPCGRTTTKANDTYGYVTRTRTTSYNKEAGCLSSTVYDVSDNSISTRQ